MIWSNRANCVNNAWAAIYQEPAIIKTHRHTKLNNKYRIGINLDFHVELNQLCGQPIICHFIVPAIAQLHCYSILKRVYNNSK